MLGTTQTVNNNRGEHSRRICSIGLYPTLLYTDNFVKTRKEKVHADIVVKTTAVLNSIQTFFKLMKDFSNYYFIFKLINYYFKLFQATHSKITNYRHPTEQVLHCSI